MMRSKSLRRNGPFLEVALAGTLAWFYLCHPPLFGEYAPDIRPENAAEIKTQETPADEWHKIESVYFTVYYRPGTDLRAVERRLGRGGFFFGSSSGDLASAAEKILSRMDHLLRKTEEALDMYPPGIHLTVKIFDSQAELNDEYYRIFKRYEEMPSFYIHKYRTIYTTESNMTNAVITHEMSHAIVDHYFKVLPPEKIREIIASYVESHLEEEGTD